MSTASTAVGPNDVGTSFFAELKRRKVGRVAFAYGGIMAGVLEISEYILTMFGMSEGLYRALLISVVAGFPVVLVLSWLFDLTPQGIELTPDALEDASSGGMSSHFTRQLLVTGAIVIVAMTGIGWSYMPKDGVQLNANLVTVLPFENRTGDPTLEYFADMAADRIVGGLGEVEGFSAVSYDPRVEEQARNREPEGTIAEAVGKYTGAALVVTGSYSRAGDDLLFRTNVHDAEAAEVVFTADDVRVDPVDPMPDFERLTDGVLGYFGVLGGREREAADATGSRRLIGRRAPTFAAYKEFVLGIREFGASDWIASAEQFELAASIDSTFFGALWRASTSRWNATDYAGVERLVERMEAMRPGLTEAELVGLDFMRASVDGDLVGVHRAAVRQVELIPTSPLMFLAGQAAMGLNRPRETLDHFAEYDLERWGGRYWPWIVYAQARHRLGQHRRELWLIRKGRETLQEDPVMVAGEFRALAARGRGEEVVERIGELRPPNRIIEVAEELEAHGDPAAAQALYERVLAALDALTPEEQKMFQRPILRVQALAALDREDEARAFLESLLEGAPDDIDYRSWAGVLAARAGEVEAAEETIAWLGALDIPYLRGRNVLEQARIAASLGDAARTVRFLEAAFEQGGQDFFGLHVDPRYRAIRDDPTFAAHMEPKG